MNKSLVYVVAVLALVIAGSHAASEEETRARLLVSKQILNKYLVEGNDCVIKYTLYNVGNGAATDVKLGELVAFLLTCEIMLLIEIVHLYSFSRPWLPCWCLRIGGRSIWSGRRSHCPSNELHACDRCASEGLWLLQFHCRRGAVQGHRGGRIVAGFVERWTGTGWHCQPGRFQSQVLIAFLRLDGIRHYDAAVAWISVLLVAFVQGQVREAEQIEEALDGCSKAWWEVLERLLLMKRFCCWVVEWRSVWKK